MNDFNRTVDSWINALDQYSFVQLCTKPSPDSWSAGQVYMHLINDTNYYLEQAGICLSNNHNADKEALPGGKIIFGNNDFPDMHIEGPASNTSVPEPAGKAVILHALYTIKVEMNRLALQISTTCFTGKTPHPGLGYFSAAEWLQFADIHLRHHFRQKKIIYGFLKKKEEGH